MFSLEHEKVAQVAMSTFFKIMSAWDVSAEDQRILLGMPSEITFYHWKNGEVSNLPNDTLERISYILGIYKALTTLFSTGKQANQWPLKRNKAFNHESALDVMLKGSITHLREVRRFLDAAQHN
ncbi:MAG: DUF2384 domain-containing protein [Gammaproteobacteria bacterium]|nr:DUF2384 domain-containing protein [Gammaproteobacteria bacterium]